MKKKTPEEFFYSFDTNMPHVEFRFYVSQLGVNIDGNVRTFLKKIDKI
jgi:hypothetical protein